MSLVINRIVLLAWSSTRIFKFANGLSICQDTVNRKGRKKHKKKLIECFIPLDEPPFLTDQQQ